MNITFYGAAWCPDCIRSKRFLDEHNLRYEYKDIGKDACLGDEIIKLNEKIGKGPYRSIPVIIIDGNILSEPTNEEIRKAIFK